MIRGRAPASSFAIALFVLAGCGARGAGHDDRNAGQKSAVVARESTAAKPGPESAQGTSARLRTGRRLHLIEDWQIEELKRQGLTEPVPALVADLARHPELIPYPGVLGGTMGFYDSTGIHVLDDQWVYASFEDGHIGGYGLFKYHVEPGGKIRWQRVSAHRGD